MSTTMNCDGCGRALVPDSPAHAVHGESPSGLAHGAGVPDDFDWCRACARAAFTLLAAHVEQGRTRAADTCAPAPASADTAGTLDPGGARVDVAGGNGARR